MSSDKGPVRAGPRSAFELTPGRFALVLAVLICVAYPDVVFGDKTFYFRDFGYFGYPLAYHHRQSFWQGEIPLWNPLNNCGLPFLAQWNTMVLYPGSLFYLLLPLSWSLSCFCLFHLFLAGIGMYGLAYRWTGNRFAASVAGLAFALNGLSLNCLMWPNNVAALGWMPLVVDWVERAWRNGGRSILLAAVVGGMQMLAGAPEIILFTWTLIAGLLVVDLWGRGSGTWRTIWRPGLAAVLVAGLAAAQLLPFIDLLGNSQRSQDFATSNWSMAPTGWANFLVPLFYCSEGRKGVFFQPGQFWTSSYYLGIGVTALALIAAWKIRRKRVWFLTVIAGLGLVLALGERGYLLGWLRSLVPQLGYMRFPIKLVTLTIFAVPLLAAFGVRELMTSPSRPSDRPDMTLLVLSLLITMSIAALLAFACYLPPPWGGWRETWKSGLSRAIFCWLIIGGLILLRRANGQSATAGITIGLLSLFALDALTHVPRQNPTISRTACQPRMVDLDPRPALGKTRAMLSPAAFEQFNHTFTSNPTNDYLASRRALFSNANLLEDIPEVSGFYSLYLREEHYVWSSLYLRTDGRDLSKLLDFLGVSHVNEPGRYDAFLTRTNCMPMVTIGQKPIFADSETSARMVADGAFSPRDVVILPLGTEHFVTMTNRTQARILSASYEAHHADLQIDAAQPSLLVLAQALYPRWRAYVDRRRVPGLRANYAYQAVPVPAGRHRVELIYRDWPFYRGFALSALTLLGCAVGCSMRRTKTTLQNV